jgi:hypothetical protein
MWTALLIAGLLLSGQQPSAIISGSVVAPPQQQILQPLQVILLPPRYLDLWNTEVQKRQDLYWQQFQPALRNQKELFTEFSKRAHWDATIYVLNRMQLDLSNKFTEYLVEIAPTGRFEFKNVSYGEYKILAMGKIGNQDVMWHELVEVQSPIPLFIELKKRIP